MKMMAGTKKSGNRTEGPRLKRTEVQRAADRQRMMQMLARGASRRQVADELDISVEQVGTDFRRAMQELAHDTEEDARVVRQVQIEQHREVIKEAYAAWEKSKLEKVRTTRKCYEWNGKDKEEYTEVREGQSGDPRFLAVIEKALDAIEDLMGVKAPKETKSDVKVEQTINWDALAQYKQGVPDVVQERIQRALTAPVIDKSNVIEGTATRVEPK